VLPVLRMAFVVGFIVVAGTLLAMLTEHLVLIDALYFTLATITTVGYGDVVPLTRGGQLLAIGLMAGGVGVALFLFGQVASFVIEGRLQRILGVRKMKQAIERMRGHQIVCGYGKLGKLVVQELAESDVDFVIVEQNPVKAADARDKGLPVIEGDATHQEVLTEAGLDRASGIATTISDDAENLYIGITARSMRADLPVVCRSSTDRVRALFEKAGITRTISIDEIGARRMVGSLIRPHIVEFMDELLRPVEGAPSLQAVRLAPGAPLIGETIQGAQLRDRFGIVVIAIQREGRVRPNPGPREPLHEGDVLILIGVPARVEELRQLVAGERGEAITP